MRNEFKTIKINQDRWNWIGNIEERQSKTYQSKSYKFFPPQKKERVGTQHQWSLDPRMTHLFRAVGGWFPGMVTEGVCGGSGLSRALYKDSLTLKLSYWFWLMRPGRIRRVPRCSSPSSSFQRTFKGATAHWSYRSFSLIEFFLLWSKVSGNWHRKFHPKYESERWSVGRHFNPWETNINRYLHFRGDHVGLHRVFWLHLEPAGYSNGHQER